jgi:hypothetical protein
LYDPKTDNSTDLWPCNSFARWVVVPRDGIQHYACGVHINTVLGELVTGKFTDLSLKDLRG